MKQIVYRLSCLIVWMAFVVLPVYALDPPKTQDEQRAWEQKFDKLNVRHTRAMIKDTSNQFLAVPADYTGPRDFTLAKTPPLIEFAVIQDLEPEYLPYDLARKTGGAWGGWGDMTRGPDGCFYFSISSHLSYNGDAYVIKYDPVKKTHRRVVSIRDIIGWTPDEFGDGKIHGDMDFGPDGTTWFLSYFAPFPTRREWNNVYRGSYVFRYNALTGKTEQFGIPLEGDSWPYFNYDWKRGVLFSVGQMGHVLVYDTKGKRLIFGGCPPDSISWYERCTMLDSETGVFYTTDSPSPLYEINGVKPRVVSEYRFVSYTRRNNEFVRMKAVVPKNPVTGKSGPCRSHTEEKDKDGAFWCFDFQGTLFKFFPAQDRTEMVGVNWDKSGSYTANMCMSPGGRYLYYIPGLAFGIPKGTPVVQYDTRTGTKKVLAFIWNFYFDKYGYSPVRCYGVELDKKGESLVFYANGGFTGQEDKTPYEVRMRRPAVYQLHIPAGERVE